MEITRNSQFYTNPKIKSKLSSGILNFIIFFGMILLITYSFFIFNSVHFISISKKAILISQYFYRAQDFHSQMIDIFVAFRQYLFDDSFIINNMQSFDYLDKKEKESYEKLFEDFQFINDFIQKFLLYDEEIQKNLKKDYCLYNITDKFSSFEECQKKLGIILNYDFSLIASNFIEQLRVSKFFFKYILSIEIVRGHLNDCDENIYLKDDTIPKIWQNYTGEYFFRLDVYNNETIHAHLDLFFVNIIIPYIEINRQIIIPHLTIDNNEIYIYIISVFYLLLIFLIYATYLLSKIKIVNNHIYKTKNLLTLIPIHILSAQNNIKELLNL